MGQTSRQDLVRTNFTLSCLVGLVWWAALLGRDVSLFGWGPHLLNIHGTSLLYLLLLIVQAMLLAVARIRQDLPARLLIGAYGALLLVIFAALGLAALKKPGLSCWNAANVSLLLYIGLSHVAFAGHRNKN